MHKCIQTFRGKAIALSLIAFSLSMSGLDSEVANATNNIPDHAANTNITQIFVCEKSANHALRNIFLKSHPNIEIVDVDIDWSIEDPIERIEGMDTLDILEVTNDEGILKLIQHGFIEPLTATSIVDEHREYFPQVKELLENNGMVMGVPIRLEIRPWLINQALWDELHLPPAPNTFDEYIDLLIMWNKDYVLHHDDYTIAGDPGWGGTKMTLTLNLLDQFIYEQQRSNEQLSFNNEKLETLLEQIFSVEELIYPEKFSGPLLQGSYDSDFWSVDISDLPSFSNTRKEGWIPIIPPVIVDGSVPKIGSELSALVILKQSQNKELAMEYLSFVSCNKDQYQSGLSLMLLSQECLLKAESFYLYDVIKMWNGFLPFISFNTDALGGHTYAREFEGVTLLVRSLFMPWTDETGIEHAPFEIEELLMNLDSDARFYHAKKH